MASRRLLVTVVAAVIVIALAAAGWWWFFGRETSVYDADHTRVEVSPGATFTLKVDDNPTTGYQWIVDDPKPDPAVVTAEDTRYDADKPVLIGSGGTTSLTYRAKARGTTTITLMHCYRCGTKYADPGRGDATTLTFHVTVR